ncbi:ABC transporter B family member 25 (ABC transporter ABCB.25) (OsABCB25) (Protein ALS1 homolog) (Protein ALUMINUM SENSITIVE 1) (OsALS1) [Durusdinium trenchii]|uniref:ABC transporter B family member 25 (ABC transporter ABCB.25) (OsABCB25) (Protein ALS1 homolog) (Protein ALUMINUM SENSITIVE 1) (OsALS1) n=1 Tax=Durusdinium trenchii TaxID=1381693 RepID=A0ABP0KUT0_9DINO
MACASGRVIGIVVLFLVDVAFVVSRTLWQPQSSSDAIVDLGLLVGRLLGSLILALVALRLVLGQWPWQNQSDIREVTRDLTRQLSGDRRETPLLERGTNASRDAPAATASMTSDTVAQLNADASSRQQQLRKLEQGEYWSKFLLFVLYVYIAACSLRVAIKVVSLDASEAWGVFWVILEILQLPVMQLEYVLIQGLVYEKSSGEGVLLPGMHEHMLFWKDAENKGFLRCSQCNEKVGELTGGFLVLQCRQCTPNRWGFGGFNVCTNCYRKNALKSGANPDASAGGLLRGDKGPKTMAPLTVTQYIRRLSGQIRTSTLVIVLTCVCCSQILNAYIPKAMGDIISALTDGSQEDFNHRIVEYALLVVANAVTSAAMGVAIQTLSTRLYANMSVKVFETLMSQDIAFYDNAMTGQMTSRLNNDLRQALSPVAIIMNTFVANIVMLVAGFTICLHASWRLTVLAFTVLTPVVHISAHFSAWAAKLMSSQWTFMADAQGCATQALTNIRTVRMFGARHLEQEKYELHTRKSMDVGLLSAWGQGGSTLLSTLVQLGASFVIMCYGGNLALRHEFNVGTIITFSYLWNRLSGAFTSLNENINQPVKAVSAGQRVFELLDLKPDIREDLGEPFPEQSKEVGIRFENVEFAYQSRADKKVLSGVTLDLRAGKTTAVVGKSGCGKSTLSKLLLRFYDPQNGSVFLNATELQHMHLHQYRSKVGVVSQDTQLFRSTVAQNITYGLRDSEFTHEDVVRAAKLANAQEFIEALPEGYNTMVGESGHDLSGGQKQRLSIARALVRRPRILLLDEATSALDAENEAYVQAALDELMKQMQGTCTIMVIAHRLSTIKDADWIIVLHEGQVAEEGTHDQLLQIKDGRYAALITRQLQGNEDESANGAKTVSQAIQEMLQIYAAVPKEQRQELFMGFAKEAKKQS